MSQRFHITLSDRQFVYLSRAAEKLGVASGREAVAKALAEGLVETRIFPMVGFSDSASSIDG